MGPRARPGNPHRKVSGIERVVRPIVVHDSCGTAQCVLESALPQSRCQRRRQCRFDSGIGEMILEGRRPLVAVAKGCQPRQRWNAVLVQMVVRIDQGGQYDVMSQLFLETIRRIGPRREAQIADDDAAIGRTGNGHIAQDHHSS